MFTAFVPEMIKLNKENALILGTAVHMATALLVFVEIKKIFLFWIKMSQNLDALIGFNLNNLFIWALIKLCM